MDNVSLGGPLRLAERDVGLIMAEAKTYGLKLNVAKCELISRGPVTLDDNSKLKEFKKISIENMTLLGASIVGPAELNVVLEDNMVQLNNAIKRLKYLLSHDALMILRNSMSTPKLIYTLRTANCVNHPALLMFDEKLREGLTQILNIDLSNNQAMLPIRCG